MFPMIATPPSNPAVARAFQRMQSATLGHIWKTQPAVRAVVHYIAANLAQLTLQLFEEDGNGDRQENRTHAALMSVRNPMMRTPGRRWIYDLATDFLIYDNAYALKARAQGQSADSPVRLPRLPVAAVEVDGGFYTPDKYVLRVESGERELEPDAVMHFQGYSPDDPLTGVSPLETLRNILTEEAVTSAASIERLKSGGLRDGYIERPLEADEWDDDDAERFVEFWAQQTAVNSSGVRDGVPVLEEGMKFVESKISPKDAQLLESRKFTRKEVAHLFGMTNCPPADTEEREQFYADVLPPYAQSFADTLDVHLCQIEFDRDDLHFAFNFQDKLRGSIAERFKTWTNAAGGPIMTRDEARREEGLAPKGDGADDLITPLNVTVGGKPSVGTMGPQDPNGPPQDGSHREDAAAQHGRPTALEHEMRLRAEALDVARREGQKRRRSSYAQRHEDLLARHFKRQRQIYRSKGTFDRERFDAELADDLDEEARRTVEREGDAAAARLMADFDLERCAAYLRKGAEERAKAINSTTANRIDEAKRAEGAQAAEGDADEKRDPFSDADKRAEEGGLAIATSLAAFGQHEAAKQTPDAALRVKQWVVTSGNSRHPELHGETVPVFSAFSNGGQFPGDPHLGPDETARCQCLLEVF
jgi:HK97 family phage portal protein